MDSRAVREFAGRDGIAAAISPDDIHSPAGMASSIARSWGWIVRPA